MGSIFLIPRLGLSAFTDKLCLEVKMKSKFITVIRYFILVLSVLNAVTFVIYEITGKIYFNSVDDQPGFGYIFQGLIYVALILSALYVYEFQKPKETGTWLNLITIWGFNIFTLLYTMGLFDFGNESRWAGIFVMVVITSIIDCMAFFPYKAFQKPADKPQ